MADDTEIKRFGEHRNAFGALRLVFALLVICAHVPELADGNRRREILTQVFGTISLGDLAVDGFFLISGFLIVGSYLKTPAFWAFLRKRIARIYPGFLVASTLSLLIVAPLGGAQWSAVVRSLPISLWKMVTLQTPDVPGVFSGTPYAFLNGAMWTISYEFRCYLFALVLGLVGAFRRRWLIALLAVAMMSVFEGLPEWLAHGYLPGIPLLGTRLAGRATLRMGAIFLAGACFRLWRDRIRFGAIGYIVASIGLVACLFDARLAEPAIATFGAYLLFGFAQWGRSGLIAGINNRDDISYGVYLYAWPITKLLLWYQPQLPVLLVGLATAAGAALCGWLSWHGIEKPVMRRVR